MRLHAKSRELDRIAETLRKLGGDLLVGDGEDGGYSFVISRHELGCEVGEKRSGQCHCKEVYKFEGDF